MGAIFRVGDEEDRQQPILSQKVAVLAAAQGLTEGGGRRVESSLEAGAPDADLHVLRKDLGRIGGCDVDDLVAASIDQSTLMLGIAHVGSGDADVVVDSDLLEVLDQSGEALPERGLLVLHHAGRVFFYDAEVVHHQEEVDLGWTGLGEHDRWEAVEGRVVIVSRRVVIIRGGVIVI